MPSTEYMRNYRHTHPELKAKNKLYLQRFRQRNPNYQNEWEKAHRPQINAYRHFYRILHADQRTIENLVAEITGRKTH